MTSNCHLPLSAGCRVLCESEHDVQQFLWDFSRPSQPGPPPQQLSHARSSVNTTACLLWVELLAKQLRVLAQKALGLILADSQPAACLSSTAHPSLLRVRKY